jgi:hypothetical protein
MFTNLALLTGLFSGLLGLLALYFHYKASNVQDQEAIKNQKQLKVLNIPFTKEKSIVNVLIVPFKQYYTKPATNIAQGIYEKLQEKYSHIAKFKYYYPLEDDIKNNNRENVIKIGNELNADIIIWGYYHLKENESKAVINNIDLTSNPSHYKEKHIVVFNNVIDGLEGGTLTKDTELNLLLKVDYIMDIADYQYFSPLMFYLFKEVLNNESQYDIITQMEMEHLSSIVTLYHEELEQSENYGLSKYAPLYGQRHEQIYKTYIEKLTYDGKNVQIGSTDQIRVSFPLHLRMTEHDNETRVNSYQILDMDGKEIDTIYVFEKSDYEYLRPPKGFKFPVKFNE